MAAAITMVDRVILVVMAAAGVAINSRANPAVKRDDNLYVRC